MRLALLLALLPALAEAGPSKIWGASMTPSSFVLARCPAEDCWTVTFVNTLVSNTPYEPVPLDLDGFVVVVEHRIQDGTIPDEFAVIPPPGYMADAGPLIVADGAAAVIVIRPLPMG